MNSVNFVVLGDHAIAGELGKRGTATDIAIYDRKTAETVYTWTVPLTFPDKVQPLLQAVGMAEYAILNVARLDRFLGEQILALDYASMNDGFILHSYDVDRERLRGLLKNTALSNYRFLESVSDLKQQVTQLPPPRPGEGPAIIPVDHAFDVKGVGTVVLGVIKQGTINAYDELTIIPHNKPVLVKSIQMHDDPVQSAASPARVGLAIKGLSANEISRGDVICAGGAMQVASTLMKIKFEKSPFFKDELAENQMYMLAVGLQIRPIRIGRAGDRLEIASEKPFAYVPGQSCVVLKPDSPSTRIIGRGILE